MNENEPSLLTLEQVMERLQISRASVYRQMESGALKSVKIGKALRFKSSDVADFINGLQSK